MGEHESWSAADSSPPSPTGRLFPNGLLPGEAASVTRPLDAERWAKAEDRTAKLIACIQPNPPSEDRRNAVARYVRRLIMECFPRQVEIFTFGSVPLKTYLPDGDIDLTAFSTNQNLKDSWANLVRDMLEKEEKNENAEFHVKEVQYIQAEVKIIKCLVENIVVDISFNQIGGLCTLCFLEEVDHYINQNHLFKRSIILIKAWCYYESRILGAHHGLISTYALETLVLYIFHVFNNSFSGPLEVLYRFLEFFSKFDWQNFCISLWGPVPVSSLPDVTAEPPRKDVGELRVSEAFLKACSRVYAVNPAAQEIQGQPFVSKHFNVIDPLRENNNLGRSVSKGNFYRIRSAFTLGAKKLARLLECPKENLIPEVNKFFFNTWERHGSGRRPDAPGNDLWLSRLGDPEPYHQPETVSNSSNSKKTQNSGVIQGARSMPSQQNNCGTETIPKSAAYQTQKPSQEVSSKQTVKPEIVVNNFHGKHLFARTRSSPELTETYGEALLQSRRSSNIAPEAGKRQTNSTKVDNSTIRKKNLESESVRHTPSPRSPDSTADMSSAVNSYYDDLASVSEEQGMQQEEQDLINSMAASVAAGQGFNGHHFPFPFNFPTGHLPFPITPSILASMGYGQRSIVPSNLPFIETPWSTTNLQFPQPFTHYFPSGSQKLSKEDTGSPELNVDESDNDLWHEQERGTHSFGLENGGYVPSSRKTRSDLENSHEDRSRSSSVKSRTSSESSWDGSTTRGSSKPTRERRNRKVVVSGGASALYGKGKSVPEHSIQIDEDNREWIPVSSSNNEITEPPPRPQGSGAESTTMSLAPFLLGHGHGMQQNDVDNSGYTFYPTGPPVPIVAMLPMYNYQNSISESHEGVENHHHHQHDSSERVVVVSSSSSRDILNGDFISHWQNLQYGRSCQNTQHPPVLYPAPVVVPPAYRLPWDGPGRPLAYTTSSNFVNQLMSYGPPRLVPVAAAIPPVQQQQQQQQQQPVSPRPNIYPRYGNETPRFRSGTGTYFPNPISPREQRSNNNTRRGSYGHERNNEHHQNDRESNWNNTGTSATKTRGSGRNNKGRSSDRHWGSSSYNRHESSSYNNGPMYRLPPGMKQNTSSSTSQDAPSVMMFYPYDHHHHQNAVYGNSTNEHLNDVGGGVGFEEPPRFRGGGSAHMSSPDDPSSPRFPRGK